jgi:hypothetical protein
MKSERFTATLRVFGWVAFLFPAMCARALSGRCQPWQRLCDPQGARVFDGRKVIEQADVWVEDGKIKAVAHDIAAILFVGGPAAGKFDFQIDEVRLE